MATATATPLQPNAGTQDTASILAWGSAVSGLFPAAGLTQTADTGQVDWTTATPTYGSGGLIGYEVWAFTDSLQTSTPVFLVVKYYQGTAGSMWITVTLTNTTNGAGTATGTLTTAEMVISSGTRSARVGYSGALTCYASGDGSYLTLVLGYGETGSTVQEGGGWLVIDRTRDSSGVATDEGVFTAASGTKSWCSLIGDINGIEGEGYMYVLSYLTGSINQLNIPGGSQEFDALFPARVYSSMSSGSVIAMVGSTVIVNGKLLPPLLGALAYWTSDITDGSVVSLVVNGSTHAYLCLGAHAPVGGIGQGAFYQISLAVRYE